MKKLFLILTLCTLACCLFAFSVSAATTDEFGTVETVSGIDLSKMSTDTTSRVVLFDGTEYHTYPANYIVKSSTDFSFDFSKLKTATGKEYGVSSIIRIEVPTTVKRLETSMNGNKGGKNIVEVLFPEGTQITEIVWGALMNCSKLERIEIPASVEILGRDAFGGCGALSSVTFAKNSNLKKIDQGCFSSCKNLTEIVIPNSVESIGKGVFYNCVGLKKLVLGANTTVFGGELDGAYGYNDANAFLEIYMNGAFSTGEGSLTSGNFLGRGNGRDLGKYVIYFTGTKQQALDLIQKYNGDVNLKDANLVPYDSSKINGTDYLGMNPYTTDITVNTNRVIVYGYNLCDAFYNGVHAEGTVINSCQFGCGRNCGQKALLENPQHNLSKVTVFGENGYFDTVCVKESCSVCETVSLDESVSPLFTNYGYSCTEFAINGGYSMSQFFGVNKQNLNRYTTLTGNAFEYGFVVSSVSDPLNKENSNLIANGKTYITEQNKFAHDYFAIAVVGITSATLDKGLAFCVYVKDGTQTYYLDNGKTLKSVELKSYNDVSSK